MSIPPQPGPAEQDPFAAPAAAPGQAPADAPDGEASGAPAAATAAAPADPAQPRPGTDLGADLGASLSFAWTAFARNAVPFVGASLIWSVLVLLLIGGGIAGAVAVAVQDAAAMTPEGEPSVGTILTIYAIIFGVALLSAPFSLLWQSGAARGAEEIIEGRRPTLGRAMVGPMRVILTALLVAVITNIGMALCILPGYAAAIFLMLAVPAAAAGASPIAAIKESFALVKANFVTVLVCWLVMGAILSVMGMLLLPLVAAVPLAVLFEVGLYHRLRGRELPEPRSASEAA